MFSPGENKRPFTPWLGLAVLAGLLVCAGCGGRAAQTAGPLSSDCVWLLQVSDPELAQVLREQIRDGRSFVIAGRKASRDNPQAASQELGCPPIAGLPYGVVEAARRLELGQVSPPLGIGKSTIWVMRGSDSHRLLSQALYERHRYAAAADEALADLALNPASIGSWLVLGRSRLAFKDPAGALKAFEQGLLVDPRDPDLLQAREQVPTDAATAAPADPASRESALALTPTLPPAEPAPPATTAQAPAQPGETAARSAEPAPAAPPAPAVPDSKPEPPATPPPAVTLSEPAAPAASVAALAPATRERELTLGVAPRLPVVGQPAPTETLTTPVPVPPMETATRGAEPATPPAAPTETVTAPAAPPAAPEPPAASAITATTAEPAPAPPAPVEPPAVVSGPATPPETTTRSAEPPAPAPAPAPAEPPAPPSATVPAPAEPITPAAPPAPELSPAQADLMRDILARARQEEESGDRLAATLSFHRAARLDPKNEEATAGLKRNFLALDSASLERMQGVLAAASPEPAAPAAPGRAPAEPPARLTPAGSLTVKAPPESAPARIGNGVYVQVASYQDRDGAEREQNIWRDRRFKPVISPWKAANGVLWQRVLLGPYPDADKAREVARRLKKEHDLDFYLLVRFPAN